MTSLDFSLKWLDIRVRSKTIVNPSSPCQHASALQDIPQSVAALTAIYPRGHDTGEHSHARAQLIYAGAGVMKVETAAGTWVIPPRRALWVPAGVKHRVLMVNEVHMRTLYIDTKQHPQLAQDCTVVEVSGLLRELIAALQQEPSDYPENSRGALLARLIIGELASLRMSPLHLPMPVDARLLRLCRAILDAPDNNATLDTLADQVGASARTLARLFRRETRMTFREWRQQARLVEALGLLAQGQPVARVAEQLGYTSPSAFSAMFQRSLGCEPRRYFESS